METLISPTADQKVCPRCGQPMPTWRNQCETCSAQLAQLPPQVQWLGARTQRPGFVTFYVVLACLGAVAQLALGLMFLVSPQPQTPLSPEVTAAQSTGWSSVWLYIAPAIATIVIGVAGLWKMRLWAWLLTVIQLTIGLILIWGAVAFTVILSAFRPGPLAFSFAWLIPGALIGGALLWFLSNRQNFIADTAPLNKTRLFQSSLLSSVVGIVLTILLTIAVLGVLMFLLPQIRSDFATSLAAFLLLPTIPIFWLLIGPMISVWFYRDSAAVAWVSAEHGAIIGITTGVASALLTTCVASVLLALLSAFIPLIDAYGAFTGQQSNLVPSLDIAPIQFTGLGVGIPLALGLLLAIPCSFFGWLGGSLGVRTQKNSHGVAVTES